MAKERIVRRVCEGLAARFADGSEARPVVWDDQIAGFGVRLNAGGSVAFILKYRVKGDPRQRFITLGDFPALKPEQAREEAAAIKGAAGLGRDLLAERAAVARTVAEQEAERRRRELPLAVLLDGWRATVEQAIAARQEQGESVLYERELLRLEAKLLRPAIGGQTVAGLNPEMFQAILARQTSVSTARNLRNLLVRFCKWANAELTLRGLPVRWPTRFEVAGRPRSRTHRFTITEAAQLWLAAGSLGRRGALVRFMLLTGCRRGEAQRVEWGHIRLDDAQLGPHWTQPPTHTKNHLEHRVPLSEPAVALLRWLPRREAKKSRATDLIFAGRGGKLVGDWTVIRRALLEGAGVDDGTLHDLRRTIVSTLGDHGFDPQVADTLLNHAAATTMGGVMGVYQRSELWLKRREAITLWTSLLMQAVADKLGRPLSPETWGFTQPFAEARIVRPERAGPRSAPRSGGRRKAVV